MEGFCLEGGTGMKRRLWNRRGITRFTVLLLVLVAVMVIVIAIPV